MTRRSPQLIRVFDEPVVSVARPVVSGGSSIWCSHGSFSPVDGTEYDIVGSDYSLAVGSSSTIFVSIVANLSVGSTGRFENEQGCTWSLWAEGVPTPTGLTYAGPYATSSFLFVSESLVAVDEAVSYGTSLCYQVVFTTDQNVVLSPIARISEVPLSGVGAFFGDYHMTIIVGSNTECHCVDESGGGGE